MRLVIFPDFFISLKSFSSERLYQLASCINGKKQIALIKNIDTSPGSIEENLLDQKRINEQLISTVK